MVAIMAELADKLVAIQHDLKPLCEGQLRLPREAQRVIRDACDIIEAARVGVLESLGQMGGWPAVEIAPRAGTLRRSAPT